MFVLSLGIFNSGKIIPIRTLAAYKCDPEKAACCQKSENNPAIEQCKSTYKVIDNPDKSIAPMFGHCYTVKNLLGPVYFNANCADGPFNAYQKADIDCAENDLSVEKKNCKILTYLVNFINALAALVGVVVVGVIVVAGIQYSSAGNDPQKLAAAKNRIVNALLALVTFIFMYAFLQWVVPGGIF